MGERPLLSIVLPMHNEAGNIEPLLIRLGAVLDRLGGSTEIIAIDDGSIDGTLHDLEAARTFEPRLRIVAFSRNFGKEVALAAGLRYARGHAVVLMDADLQHPPELIGEFVRRWREGYQMVYAVRRARTDETWLRRWAAQAFYRLFAKLSSTELPRGGGDFRLLDARVVQAMNELPERTRFTKGLYAWLGFRQVGVPYDVAQRHTGRSVWNLRSLLRLSVDGIVSFSTLPLRIWSYVGAVISLMAMGFAGFILVRTLLLGSDVAGYPSLIVAVTFFAGVQLLSLGIIGEYVGRIFTEVKRRPLWIVSREIGFEPQPGADLVTLVPGSVRLPETPPPSKEPVADPGIAA